MRTLGWNCWGICNASTVSALKAQIRGCNPMILFLSETKANEKRMKKVANLIGFPNFIAISPKGRTGGICLLWANEVDVKFWNSIPIQLRLLLQNVT